jgi:hypothetical protein
MWAWERWQEAACGQAKALGAKRKQMEAGTQNSLADKPPRGIRPQRVRLGHGRRATFRFRPLCNHTRNAFHTEADLVELLYM